MVDIVPGATDDAAVTDTAIRHFYEQLGQHVRDARTAAGLTQAALAHRLALTRASVANLEAGRQRISAYTLAVVAAVLDLPPGDLLPPVIAPQQLPGVRPDAPAEHVALLQQLLAASATTNTRART